MYFILDLLRPSAADKAKEEQVLLRHWLLRHWLAMRFHAQGYELSP